MRFFFNPVSGQLNAGPPREIVYADTAPLYPSEGSRWFDTINLREYVYTGTEWVESGVGPAGVKGDTGNKGDKGDVGPVGPVGPQGPAATVAVGTVTTGAAGTNASVSNSGTSGAAVFDFTIPQGAKGDPGNIGPQGPQGIQGVKGDDGASITLKGAVATPADLTSIVVKTQGDLYVVQSDGNGYVWDGSNWVNVGQIRGPKGDTGAQGPVGPAPAGTGVVVVSNGIAGTPVGYGSTNIANTLVRRDASGNFSAGVITGNLTGNVTGGVTGSVTGNASTASKLATAQTINVSGDVTGTAQSFDGSAGITIPTAIAPGAIINADINSAAAISDTKLATISTAGKVSNSATTATSANTASAIVARDTNGDFSAGIVTANLSGNAATASSAAKLTTSRKINNVSFDGSADITITAAPTSHTHPYSQITDSPYKDGAVVATTSAINANYSNGAAGAGATLTFPTAFSDPLNILKIDGVTVTVGMRVLVKNQQDDLLQGGYQNGIYTMTTLGSASAAWVLTRATDADSSAELGGAIISVDRGTSGGKLFSTSFRTTDTIGTTACLWQQIYDQGDASTTNTANTLVFRDGSGNFSAGTITAALSGNATSATSAAKFTTPRKINSVSFDGSADITISAAPTSHTHGNISNAGAIGTTASLPIITGTSGVLQAGSFGTIAGTFCQGNDTRLSDSRTPTSHTHPYSQITDSPYKDGVTVATTAALTANYANGTSGVGATLTNAGTLAALVIDGVTATVGMRVLVKNQATTTQNGIYSATSVGSTAAAWVLTRATDSDSNTELGGAIVSVDRGTSGGKLFSTSFKTTDTVGTTACLWQQIYDQGDGSLLSPWTTKTAAYTAVAGDRIVANTTAAAFTITLPASPAAYTEIVFADHYEQWATRNLTIARNGQNIEGLAENLVCNVAGVQFTMRYEGTTWRIYT